MKEKKYLSGEGVFMKGKMYKGKKIFMKWKMYLLKKYKYKGEDICMK